PSRRPSLSFLRRDEDDTVRCVGAVQRRGGWPFDDLDVLDLLGRHAIQETECRSAVARRAERARERADAVDEDDRRIAKTERVQATNADVRRRSRRTLAKHADPRRTSGEQVADRRNRQLLDLLTHVAERGDAVSELDAALFTGRRRYDFL